MADTEFVSRWITAAREMGEPLLPDDFTVLEPGKKRSIRIIEKPDGGAPLDKKKQLVGLQIGSAVGLTRDTPVQDVFTDIVFVRDEEKFAVWFVDVVESLAQSKKWDAALWYLQNWPDEWMIFLSHQVEVVD